MRQTKRPQVRELVAAGNSVYQTKKITGLSVKYIMDTLAHDESYFQALNQKKALRSATIHAKRMAPKKESAGIATETFMSRFKSTLELLDKLSALGFKVTLEEKK